ncbi:MAG: hypothetical protein RL328_1864 [Acidobacteriota bacterium]|jgi:predicted RNA-binding Zn-ribbon protein involved in translation (DUF1610 family)
MDENDVFDDDEAVEVKPRTKRLSLTCPKCGTNDIRRSNFESIRVSINRAFGRWPFRCRNCRALFFRPSPPPPEA